MFGHNVRNVDDLLAHIPDEIPVLPLRNTVAYPFILMPLAVGTPSSLELVQDAMELTSDKLLLLVPMKDSEAETPTTDNVYDIGSVAVIQRAVTLNDGTIQLFIQTLERARVVNWTQESPYLKAKIQLRPDVEEKDSITEALRRGLLDISREIVQLMPNVPDQIADALEQMEDDRLLIYAIASNARLDDDVRLQILNEDSLNAKMRLLLDALRHEKEVLEIGQEIREKTQEDVTKEQRDFILRRQLEQIRKELGGGDDVEITEKFRQKIEDANMPEEAHQQAMSELSRMESLTQQSPEYSVIRTYLDWLVEVPWSNVSDDNLDVQHARDVLDADHYDLKEVKDRIIEHLAVRKLAKERGSEIEESEHQANAILLFVGPPGVGKTSLGKSIARALGREFTRMSLGGMRDESEIRGHRRTYIGAMPGRIIQAIKRTGTRNPVMMLDEIDKVGSDWRGDPSSALLEVLDPQQNHAFRDHYLDVDFDLSDIMFIATANQLETIPPALLDRMELIQLDGYTEYDKVQIAEKHLVERQRKANSLRPNEVSFTELALRQLIREYTREAGVRNLERTIGSVMRKVAIQIASGAAEAVEITPRLVREYLGKPKYRFDAADREEIPGIATGLAWTPVGGGVLFVEAARTPGTGKLTITGQLGKVMEESVRLAYSYLYAQAERLNIDENRFKDHDFHIHVPEGAIPKDGPSAGITMTTALYSLLTEQGAKADVAMTGEITLRGQVLPIGGVKMKVLAAHRGGIRTIILPEQNMDDLDDLPDHVREEMTFVPVKHIDEVLAAAIRFESEEAEISPAA